MATVANTIIIVIAMYRKRSLRIYLDFQHAQSDLEEHQRALVEEQVPDTEEQTDVHHAGK